MARYIISRIVDAVPVLFLISVLSFGIVKLIPGDVVTGLLGADAQNQEYVDHFRHQLGLDKPIPEQYARWLGRLFEGDMGTSLSNGYVPVTRVMKGAIMPSLQLGLAAMLICVVVGVPLGVVAALKFGTPLDSFVTAISVAGFALPSFFLGILLLLLFSVKLGWLPLYGYVNVFTDPVGGLKTLVLPAFALGLGASATIARQTRASMLEVLRQDYIRTATAKGLKHKAIVMRHALRNASLPIVTLIGINVGYIVGGSAIIEQMFAIPGMGRLAIRSAFARDLPTIQAITLILACSVLVANLLTDLSYTVLDPRIRYNK